MTTACIAFGANEGDPANAFAAAARVLASSEARRSIAMSSLWQTVPAGGPGGQPTYFNACFRVETDWPAPRLFAELCEIETKLGRTRDQRWGPRPIDLDLLFFGIEVINSSALAVPHPRLHWRRFVLDPLAEVAPDLVHPCFGLSARSLRDRASAVRHAICVPTCDHGGCDDSLAESASLLSGGRVSLRRVATRGQFLEIGGCIVGFSPSADWELNVDPQCTSWFACVDPSSQPSEFAPETSSADRPIRVFPALDWRANDDGDRIRILETFLASIEPPRRCG